MVDLGVVRKAVQTAKNAAAGALEKMPSPGDPNAEQGEDCGCGRRKKAMIENLRKGRSAAQIVKDALADIRGKEPDGSA
ncbi:hypothetical protein LCGC14_2806900 [marine sediment metagenome]|uniref:Uncharacterized protein n=1 Tax=marine sediment metagenome TaxID=412755 RepID=A0A0F9BCD7_9ZZZZ